MRVVCLVVFGLGLAACGGSAVCPGQPVTAGDAPAAAATASTARPGVKMRHQILFSGREREDVFDGFMVLLDEGFYVKAFAGPGVELFTVARQGERRKDTLHIEALADRIDVARIGSDIYRVYQEGCGEAAAGTHECVVQGETLRETVDRGGDTVERVFPEAHGIGLTVVYRAYGEGVERRRLPKETTLRWGEGANRMVIRLVSVAPADGDEAEVLETLLE